MVRESLRQDRESKKDKRNTRTHSVVYTDLGSVFPQSSHEPERPALVCETQRCEELSWSLLCCHQTSSQSQQHW